MMATQTAQRSPKLVNNIQNILESGELVIVPTEVSYIIVAHAFKPRAIRKIAQLKRWNAPQPLVLLTRREKVEEFGVVSAASQKLINHFPYPITLIIPKKILFLIQLPLNIRLYLFLVPMNLFTI